MSKLMCFLVVYLLVGLAYSYHLHEEANQALKAEEQRAIQRRHTVVSYMAKKRKDSPRYSSAELRTNAKRTFTWFAGSSVVFVMIGWSTLVPAPR